MTRFAAARRPLSRRDLLRRLGVGSAVLPFLGNLPSLAAAGGPPKKRLVIIFSPDGVVRKNFWPKAGPLAATAAELPPILQPLAPFRDQLLTVKGVHNKVKGDGDWHLRGIGCLLTGVELFPGTEGGAGTPAGWSSGRSIDQEIRQFLQARPATATRFGSLEFGVLVPDKATTPSRMVYAGPNRPVAPIDDPYQMFEKLYGRVKQRESMRSVLDDIRADLAAVAATLPADDRHLLQEHETLVQAFERELAHHSEEAAHFPPVLEPGVFEHNDRMPQISRMQIELLVAALAADFTRVATLQYTQALGGARFTWLGIDKDQHNLSHEPETNAVAQEQLTRINAWYAAEIAHLARRLAETPEPGGDGSMLDHTTIAWTNELGDGNHSLEDIPWVFLGNGLGFSMGRAIEAGGVPHNRLLLSLAHAMGLIDLARFGNPDFCGDGPLTGLT
jgi:hypothetical protein